MVGQQGGRRAEFVLQGMRRWWDSSVVKNRRGRVEEGKNWSCGDRWRQSEAVTEVRGC